MNRIFTPFTLGILFSICLCTNVYAQKSSKSQNNPTKDLEAKVDGYILIDEYQNALPYLLKLDSLKPGDGKTNYNIGLSYYRTVYKSKSLRYFKTAKEKGFSHPELDFYLARAYHFNHDFTNAELLYQSVIQKTDTSHSIGKTRYKETERYLRNCIVGKQLMKDSLSVLIENLGPKINTAYPEYSPVVSADETEMFFTSRRTTTTGGKIDEQDGLYFEDIYQSIRDNNEWSLPRNMGDTINSTEHDACIGLSPDGLKLFIYKSFKSRVKSGHIFYSDYKSKKWSFPKKLEGEINSKTWEGSATITADEKTLFFSSDRKGGYGGIDIYYCKKTEGGKWGLPKNLGPSINTAQDDDAPVIHADGKTIFFASRGHDGMGGYDIFYSKLNVKDSIWSKPTNIGYPINTADDDIYFSYTADGSKGYFSSYRSDSYGEKDIYVVHRPANSPSMIVMKGKIMDKKTGQPIAATILVKDKESNKVEGIFNAKPTGKYSGITHYDKSYDVTISALGYFPTEVVFDMPEQSGEIFQISRDYALEEDPSYKKRIEDSLANITLEAEKAAQAMINKGLGEKISLSSESKKGKKEQSFVLSNILFDYKKTGLTSASKRSLNKVAKILNKYKDVSYTVAGHTDAIGSDAYNQKLSENRAQVVLKYLLQKGIAAERLESIGYGESQPIAPNDSDKNRQKNRRVELIKK